MTSTDIEH